MEQQSPVDVSRVSRRHLLRWALGGAGLMGAAGLLTACGGTGAPAPGAASSAATSASSAASTAAKTASASVSASSSAATSASTAATSSAAAPSPALKGVQQLVLANGGGALSEAFKKSYFEPFTKLIGVKIVEAANDIAKLKAMVESKNIEWDLAQVDAALAAGLARQNLLEALDYGVIKKDQLVEGVAKELYLPCDFAACTIAWNTKSFPNGGPKTWAEYWDEGKFKGKRGFWKKPVQTLELALIADGVDFKKLYPLDVDRAFKALDRIKKSTTFWTSGAQSIQLLMDRELDLSMIWNGRIQGPKDDGKPVDFTFNQALIVGDSWVVPRGSKNKAAAMEFIAFAVSGPTAGDLCPEHPLQPGQQEGHRGCSGRDQGQAPAAAQRRHRRAAGLRLLGRERGQDHRALQPVAAGLTECTVDGARCTADGD